MIASSSSRNSSKNMPRFSSNDMVHNYYLKEAKKKTQERDRKSTTSVMPSAKSQNTTKSYKSKPRSNNQTSRVLPTSKSSCPTTTVMPKADHSRNSKVNSRAKIQPNKTRNSNKPVDPTSHTQKPDRKIVTGHSFSPNKSSAVHEKTNTPRSYLRWIPTGRIFNTAGLKWVPTGKTFTSSTTKVDCELPNGSNDYITNSYKCDQTLNVSAGTLNLSAGTFCNPEKERLGVCLLKKVIYQKPRVPGIYAPLLKEKKSVRFSALYLQKKRNLLSSFGEIEALFIQLTAVSFVFVKSDGVSELLDVKSSRYRVGGEAAAIGTSGALIFASTIVTARMHQRRYTYRKVMLVKSTSSRVRQS
ncbi:hypothetical protein Tco_0947218 [Tanacetum coccineum]